MPTDRFDKLILGTNLSGTDNADGSITIDATGGGGGGVMPGARAYRATDQSVADSTITIISFSAVRFDNDSLWSAGSPTRLTCTEDGIYSITANAQWQNNATGFRSIAIRLDGATVISVAQLGVASVAPGGGQACTTLACHYELTVGQYIEFQMYQDNSTNVALNVLASSDFSPSMSMVKVSD